MTSPVLLTNLVCMGLDAAVRHAIVRSPSSTRALARAAGVSHVMLLGIVAGRERATARVALAVATALQQWADRCANDARAVKAAAEGHKQKGVSL